MRASRYPGNWRKEYVRGPIENEVSVLLWRGGAIKTGPRRRRINSDEIIQRIPLQCEPARPRVCAVVWRHRRTPAQIDCELNGVIRLAKRREDRGQTAK